MSEFHSLNVPHLAVKGPSFLPNWLFGYAYPHNVIGAGIKIPGCSGPYCSYLPIPVFPTPFYETIICLGLFFLLWSVRKKFKVPGTMFAFYLIINGIERFFIEKIRVNSRYSILGFIQHRLKSFPHYWSSVVFCFIISLKSKTEWSDKPRSLILPG